MQEPRDLIKEIEHNVSLPISSWERFSGYGIMGLPFSSGHILGLRCFPGSSLGVPYRSVWHRDAEGSWAFYQNAPPEKSCPRYFGNTILKVKQVSEISINWSGAYDLSVSIEDDVRLEWKVTLSSTHSTRLMNFIAGMIPSSLWQKPGLLNVMGVAASLMLGAGHLGLNGKVPNGQRFIANPRRIWIVKSSAANINGLDLGPAGRLRNQARLQDFWIPQQGIFAIGDSMFEPYDPAIHSPRYFSKQPVSNPPRQFIHLSNGQ
jgi:hypothetical protein